MQLMMRVWRLICVIATSLSAAEAGVGQVMVLEDEPLSTTPASKPIVPGTARLSNFSSELAKRLLQ